MSVNSCSERDDIKTSVSKVSRKKNKNKKENYDLLSNLTPKQIKNQPSIQSFFFDFHFIYLPFLSLISLCA